MFKTIKELQDFILWAKAEKLKRLKVGDVEIEISDYALVADLLPSISQTPNSEPQSAAELARMKKEEEDLLNWSAN